MTALKQHVALYLMALVFGLGLGGAGYLIAFNLGNMLAGAIFMCIGLGIFCLMFYLNFSSMQYYFDAALMKKYARYRTAAITEIEKEVDEKDEVVRCFITVNYEGHTLTDLFEILIKNEHLLENLKKNMRISIRIADQRLSEMRISPKKLLKQLEALYKA